MFEHHSAPLLPRDKFLLRAAAFAGVGAVILGIALGIGVVGYHLLAGLNWVDSILNASMILGGMGPVDPLPNDASKLFASGYAIFAGTIFLVAVGVMLSPLLHRLLHRMHLDTEDAAGEGKENE